MLNISVDQFTEARIVERLLSYLRQQLGTVVELESIHRFTVGFSWLTYGFEIRWSHSGTARQERLILRIGPPDGLFAPYSSVPQFESLRVLADTAVPVPRVYWHSDDPSVFGAPFFICQWVEGDAPVPWVADGGEAFTPEIRERIGSQFIVALAALHNFEWRDTPVAFLAQNLTVENCADAQIQYWEKALRRWELRRYPIMEWAIHWLKARCPVAPRLSLIHGDYRIGNFLAKEGDITAILDWELVHIGDPHEDLGFMCLRPFRGRSKYMCHLVDREELYRRHGELTGIEICPRTVHFYEVFNMIKLAIIHVGASRCFEDGRFNDLRMPAMGAQISRILMQTKKLVGDAP